MRRLSIMDNDRIVETPPRERQSAAPQVEDLDRIERALGWRPTSFHRATAQRGDSDTAARWIVADHHAPGARRRSVFVKIGANELTAGWTRVEYRNYRSMRGMHLPDVVGFYDDA
ncbi:hypothetical protein BH20CHL6_BH20CHL6_17500 [soil metagenome]